MTDVTREQHLDWCKKEAHDALARGDVPREVLKTFVANLKHHPDTKDHPGINRHIADMLGNPSRQDAEDMIADFD